METFTRIRYVKNADGLFESVKSFNHQTNGASYKVSLNPENKQWQVIETTTELIAASGRNSSLAKMKIEAKKALGQLGIEFTKDAREPKGYKTAVVEVDNVNYGVTHSLDDGEVA